MARSVFQDPQTGAIKLPDCVSVGLSRALAGFIYVAIFQIGTLYVSDQYLFEPSFQKKNLIKKCLLIGLWGRINLYKYVSCWLITEGVCNQDTLLMLIAFNFNSINHILSIIFRYALPLV